MIFLDGPAKLATLDTRRVPLLLRVVIDSDGTVDALDQLSDAPKPSERIHVYQRVGKPSTYHVLCTPRRLSGWHVTAEYRLYEHQPDDATARDSHAWREWAARQWQAICAAVPRPAQSAESDNTVCPIR